MIRQSSARTRFAGAFLLVYIYGMATADIPSSITAIHPSPRLWTREEYYCLHEQGFFAGQRVELIEGKILLMSPVGPDHDSAVGLVLDALLTAFVKGYWIRPQMSLALGKRREPQADIAVVEIAINHPLA